MENAAKALLIAGGILLAILTLTAVVYMSTATSRMIQAQEEKKAVEEIEAFNKEYEAYNKKRMYGTEVITVVKKAIEYNSKGGEQIEIELTVHSNFETVVETIKTNKAGEIISIKNKEPRELKLEAGTYSTNDLKNFFNQEPNDELNVPDPSEKYKITNTYSALTTFKRSIFVCTDVEYGNSGRIKKMSFEEFRNFSEY